MAQSAPISYWFTAVILALNLWSAAGLAAMPLLMDGKRTLYQRILTHPGTQLYSAPGAAGQPVAKPLPAFSVFYVYGRQTVGDELWAQVGVASSGEPDGWLAAGQFSDWKQTLVLKFAERSGRVPVLFFRTQNALATALNDPAHAQRVQALLDQAQAAKAGKASTGELVALEPQDAAVSQNRFYLLPIFNFSEAYTPSGQPVQLLQVALIDPSVESPHVVAVWVSDHDLVNPARPAFQVFVLLTQLQLNDLQKGLQAIADAAVKARINPQTFFQQVVSTTAHVIRDPNRLRQQPLNNLYESGLLGEFLEGLPYKSKVLGITQDLWLSWQVGEQQDFIDELQSKIKLYEKLHNDPSYWIRFSNAAPSDAVYLLPLRDLP